MSELLLCLLEVIEPLNEDVEDVDVGPVGRDVERALAELVGVDEGGEVGAGGQQLLQRRRVALTHELQQLRGHGRITLKDKQKLICLKHKARSIQMKIPGK
jgi:hypothetical protein